MTGVMAKQGPSKLILKRAKEGDRAAVDELFDAFRDRIRAFIRSRLKPGHGKRLDPEEILQDTFIRAFRSIGSFNGEDPEQFRRWLTGVANKTVFRAEAQGRRNP